MGLDVARALAVLGMVGAHVGMTAEELKVLDPSTWSWLVHGRSSILFAVLAGISIALMTGRAQPPVTSELPAVRLGLLGRGAALFIIGILLELLGTPVAIILTVYGLLYVAAIPFLTWRPRRLLVTAAVLAVAGPVLLASLRVLTLNTFGPGVDLVLFGTYPMTVWMALVLAGMGLGRLRLHTVRTAATLLAAGVVLTAAGYGLGALGGFVSSDTDDSDIDDSSVIEEAAGVPADELKLDGALCEDWGGGEYYCYPADQQEETGDTTDTVVGEGDLLVIGEPDDSDSTDGWGEYVQGIAEEQPLESIVAAVFAVDPHSGGVAETVGSGGFAMAVIALCLLVSRPLRWVLLPLAALGSMPLTAYSAHVVAILVIAGPGAVPGGEDAWGWFALVLLVTTTAWSVLWGRGPLERLVARAAEAMQGSRHAASRELSPVITGSKVES